MRRPPIVLAVVAIAAIGSVGGAFAFRSDGPPADPAQGLDALMASAEAQGAYSINCSGFGDSLACSPMKDEDVMPALRRGETVYGRTVIGFPGGAKVSSGADPRFEATDLICSDASDGSLGCSPVTRANPTVPAGAETFVFYRKHNVTFDKSGHPTGHAGAPTVPLRVIPG
jgi:hypothetical protein